MHSATDAYNQTAKITRNPRELEASLLLKSASRLQSIKETWSNDAASLYDALHFNRRLWTVFVSAVMEKDSPLPLDIRNNIANLGVFIFKQTIDAETQPAPEKLNSLIQINRQIAAGLDAA